MISHRGLPLLRGLVRWLPSCARVDDVRGCIDFTTPDWSDPTVCGGARAGMLGRCADCASPWVRAVLPKCIQAAPPEAQAAYLGIRQAAALEYSVGTVCRSSEAYLYIHRAAISSPTFTPSSIFTAHSPRTPTLLPAGVPVRSLTRATSSACLRSPSRRALACTRTGVARFRHTAPPTERSVGRSF